MKLDSAYTQTHPWRKDFVLLEVQLVVLVVRVVVTAHDIEETVLQVVMVFVVDE